MQPTLPQTAGTADMDLTAVQSMDWLFKKERIYLLAQFWQQRATLAEKEVNTLKEQLSTASTATITSTSSTTTTTASSIHSSPPSPSSVRTTPTTTPIPNIKLSPTINNNSSFNNNNNNNTNKLSSVAIAQHLHQNGNLLAATPSPSPPLSENSSTLNGCLNSAKLLFNHNQIMDTTTIASSTATTTSDHRDGNAITTTAASCIGIGGGSIGTDASKLITAMTAEMNLHQDTSSEAAALSASRDQMPNRSHSPPPLSLTAEASGANAEPTRNNNNNNNNNSTSNNNKNTNSNSGNSCNNNLADELAAKEKEIKALIDEVNRLQALQETHIVQIQRLEDNVETKRQHILRLEARLEQKHQLISDVPPAPKLSPDMYREDDEPTASTTEPPPLAAVVHPDEVHIKKENQTPLGIDITSQSVAVAAAAVVAAANDPKQFQELLLERTKALAAAAHASSEALKSEGISSDTISADTIKDTAENEPLSSEPNDLSQQPQQQQQQLRPLSESTAPSISTDQITPSSNFQSVDQFGSLLGGELVNSYWRRGFDLSAELKLPPPPNHLPLAPPAPLPSTPRASPATSATVSIVHPPPSIMPTTNPTSKTPTSIFQNFPSILSCRSPPPLSMSATGPSTATLLSQLVNSTFSSNPTPSLRTDTHSSLTTPTTATTGSHLQQSSQQLHQQHLHHHQQHQQHQQHQHQHQHQQQLHATALQHHQQQQQQHQHQEYEKANSHHDSSSTASTPNLQDQRSNDEHLNGGGAMKSAKEDNNNSLGSLAHLPPAFLPGLPFQFQDRGHFRFAEDIQLPPGASMAGRLGESLIPKGDPMEAKLQEMLRYNMDKYANQSLDTLHISRRVRELLSVHNIGQRLFAKYILGLSQGTVSELLSKPKPWDKLTEKGRDSYRKMHAWGCDDNAVMLLKSLIPKKDSGIPQYGRNEDSMSDDRIAHILNEASSLMKTPQGPGVQLQQQIQHEAQRQQQQQHQQSSSVEDSHSNEDSKSPHASCISPFYKESPVQQQQQQQRQDVHRRSVKPDDMSQDKVARIYQEELAKLMTRTPRDAFPSGAGGLPPTNTAIPPDDNIRITLEAYHREMAKLQQNSSGNIPNFPTFSSLMALQQQVLNGAQDLSVPKENEMKVNGQRNSMESCESNQTKEANEEAALRHSSAFSLVRNKPESTPVPNSNSNANTNSAAPSPLSNSILQPAMTPTDDFSTAASPLQRMASITNSLITQPPVTPHHTQPQRPTKAVLPPITQQQFDMFNNLNTEEIVRRVKEALSQYSISQRLFGESVLGLSQGSVSDLLARPKPWHMLTQKGREPFIRMKMFLEDENAVHKLVASQYKIAPEKLMRTGSYSGSPQIPQGLANKMNSIPMQKMMNELKMQEPQAQHIMQQMQAASAMAVAAAAGHMQNAQHQGMLLTTPGLPPQHAISLQQAAAAAAANEKKPMIMPIHSPHQANAMRSSMHQHMSPTVYEMAALTQDLDTQVITTKIKEALLANNIGQKIFGEAVLGLSQGSVSELLSKPKPWHMLSIKGREPFIRMQLWLSDANNVERLQVLKNERREASKRRRSTGPNQQDNSSDTSSNDTADFYTSSPGPGSVGSVGAPPNKKQRVLFSEEQKEALRLAFALDPYPNVGTIEFLANELGLATRTITNWFHNHRMRLKQQVPHGQPTEPVPSRENTNATPFDPVQFRILLNQRLMELQKERMGLSNAPIPYPPYFAANPNLAALIGRGLLPGGGEPDLQALNNAFKEQMSGLDLSLKRERDDDFEDDGEGDSHLSDNESINGSDEKSELSETPRSSISGAGMQSRTSRRKPAAPQWVNPEWQGDGKTGLMPPLPGGPADKEVIINGVCVMQQQAADYSRKSSGAAADDDDDGASDGNEDEPSGHHRTQSSDCDDPPADIDQRFMEPEVRIKQEEDCDSNDSHHDDHDGDVRKQPIHRDDEDDTPGVWNY